MKLKNCIALFCIFVLCTAYVSHKQSLAVSYLKWATPQTALICFLIFVKNIHMCPRKFWRRQCIDFRLWLHSIPSYLLVLSCKVYLISQCRQRGFHLFVDSLLASWQTGLSSACGGTLGPVKGLFLHLTGLKTFQTQLQIQTGFSDWKRRLFIHY